MQYFSMKLPSLSTGAFTFTRPHIFHRLTDEGVAVQFLRAVAADVEQARAFVSKNSPVDLDAVRNIMCQEQPSFAVGLKKAGAVKSSGLRTQSVLLRDCILHLHMVEERQGTWKVYGVDRESR